MIDSSKKEREKREKGEKEVINIMAKQQQKSKRLSDSSGIFVPAGLFIGMGIGFLTSQFLAGLFIGLGAGLALMALTQYLSKKH